MNFFNRKKSNGFSLVEVIVLIGISSFVVLGFMKTMQQSLKVSKAYEVDLEIGSVVREVSHALSDFKSCELTLKSPTHQTEIENLILNAPVGQELSLDGLVIYRVMSFASGDQNIPILEDGSQYAGFTLSSLKLEKISDADVDLKMFFVRDKGVIGPEEIERKVPIALGINGSDWECFSGDNIQDLEDQIQSVFGNLSCPAGQFATSIVEDIDSQNVYKMVCASPPPPPPLPPDETLTDTYCIQSTGGVDVKCCQPGQVDIVDSTAPFIPGSCNPNFYLCCNNTTSTMRCSNGERPYDESMINSSNLGVSCGQQ